MIRTLSRAVILVAVCAVAIAAPLPGPARAATPGSGGVTYGIADSQGAYARCSPGDPFCCDSTTSHCDPSSLSGFFDSPLFRRLTTSASAHRVADVRLFVNYDAVQEFNGSTTSPGCVYSRALRQSWTDLAGRRHPAGESWSDLQAGLIEARAQGLVPTVAISGYGSPHAMPAWDQPAPDPTTVGGYWEYRCGLQGILDAASRLPVSEQPHVWEAFNEPDGFAVFRSFDGAQADSCAITAPGQPGGGAKAACDEAIATQEIHQFAGHGTDTVIAGAFMRPSPTYLSAYAVQLARLMPGAAYPSIWSVHDYGDVVRAYAGPTPSQLAAFDQALASDSGGRAHELWITEAATVLTDHQPGGGCPAIGVDAAGSLGACVNGQPSRQAADAAAFFALPSVATAVPITHLFWYEFQSTPNWDSGLVDASSQPRVPWCAFYGSGTCAGDPDAW